MSEGHITTKTTSGKTITKGNLADTRQNIVGQVNGVNNNIRISNGQINMATCKTQCVIIDWLSCLLIKLGRIKRQA